MQKTIMHNLKFGPAVPPRGFYCSTELGTRAVRAHIHIMYIPRWIYSTCYIYIYYIFIYIYNMCDYMCVCDVASI